MVDVPEECGLLSPRELEITGTDADVLLRKLVDREYSSYEVGWAASCRVVWCRVVLGLLHVFGLEEEGVMCLHCTYCAVD